jgi:hypothetical protein
MLEMSQTPELLTRDFWLSLWEQGDDDAYWLMEAERQWTENFAGDVGDHLDPAIPTADLAALREGSERVTRYVDMNVARLDARTVPRGSGQPEGETPEAPGRRPPTSDSTRSTSQSIWSAAC